MEFTFLKTFNEIVLDFLSLEIKTNMLYVNIDFTGNLLLGFEYSNIRTLRTF